MTSGPERANLLLAAMPEAEHARLLPQLARVELADGPAAGRLSRLMHRLPAAGDEVMPIGERLAVGAVEQARLFSWDATAAQTLEVYQRAGSFMREAVAG